MDKVKVHWSSLLLYGLVFWLTLCLLGNKSPKHILEHTRFPENSMESESILSSGNAVSFNINDKLFKFGWSLFVWNTATFLLSFGFCYSARTIFRRILNFLLKLKRFHIPFKIAKNKSQIAIVKNFIPQLSETHIGIKSKIKPDVSCPNLMSKRGMSNIFQQPALITKCQTIYKNNKLFPIQKAADIKFNGLLEIQCNKLREEIAKLQATSLKERTVLARKLETVSKEKRELAKHLAFVQKENRGAKQELEELLQEKNTLLKRLENATKELRTNTKSKKVTLAKLEEVTTTSDNLNRELEQMTRDKEILESKMKVLQGEYEKLQQRVLRRNVSYESSNFHGQAPERDSDNNMSYESRQNQTEYETIENTSQGKLPTLCASISSCADFDMRNIDIEIRRLERNLDHLNSPKKDDDIRSGGDESELSLSYREKCFMSEIDLPQDNRLINSTKLKYWGGRAGDMVGALATKMNQKVRYLHNIHERHREDSTEMDEYDASCHESLDDLRPPIKIVSGSIAFQNFLRSLQPGNCVRRQFLSQSDIRF